jgi:hypothetical protein
MLPVTLWLPAHWNPLGLPHGVYAGGKLQAPVPEAQLVAPQVPLGQALWQQKPPAQRLLVH